MCAAGGSLGLGLGLKIDDEVLQHMGQRGAVQDSAEGSPRGVQAGVPGKEGARCAQTSGRGRTEAGCRAAGHAHEQHHAIALEGDALDSQGAHD